MTTKITLKQVKAGAVLPDPIYKVKPYVVLSKEDVVLAAGDLNYLRDLSSYFDEFPVEVRQHDLHANDNSKIAGGTKAKHTPGPWKVAQIGNNLRIAGSIPLEVAVVTNLKGGMTEANARLIAAAPELLEACQLANETMNAYFGIADEDESGNTAHDIIRKAIATATTV